MATGVVEEKEEDGVLSVRVQECNVYKRKIVFNLI